MKTFRHYLARSVVIVAMIAAVAVALLAYSGRLAVLRPSGSALIAQRLRTLANDCKDGNLGEPTSRTAQATVPSLSSKEILSWASTTLPRVMTFGYGDYYDKLRDARSTFSPGAYCKFINSLVESDMLAEIVDKQLHLSLIFLGNPEIDGSVAQDGQDVWSLKIPVALQFTRGASTTLYRATTGVLKVTVSRKQKGGSATAELNITQIVLSSGRS